jgi:hypothetical protein
MGSVWITWLAWCQSQGSEGNSTLCFRRSRQKRELGSPASGLEEGPSRKEESKMQAQNPGKIIDATTTTLQDLVLSSRTPVAVDFWAPW